jgi:hypothetical protein
MGVWEVGWHKSFFDMQVSVCTSSLWVLSKHTFFKLENLLGRGSHKNYPWDISFCHIFLFMNSWAEGKSDRINNRSPINFSIWIYFVHNLGFSEHRVLWIISRKCDHKLYHDWFYTKCKVFHHHQVTRVVIPMQNEYLSCNIIPNKPSLKQVSRGFVKVVK